MGIGSIAGSLRDPQAIGIATINAALVAIFFAALVAYVVVVIQRSHEMTDSILDAANEASELPVPIAGVRPGNQDAVLAAYVLESEQSSGRHHMVDRLFRAANNLPEGNAGDPRPPPEESARHALAWMYALTSQFPFPRAYIEESGTPIPLSPFEPLSFTSERDAAQWADAMQDLARELRLVFHSRDRLRVLMSLEDDSGHIGLQDSPGVEVGRTLEEMLAILDPNKVPDRFLEVVSRGAAIAHEVRRRCTALATYRNARFSKKNLGRALAASTLAALVLIVGVIVPIVHESAPRWMFAWVPAAIYVAAVAMGLAMLVRAYLSSEDTK